MKRNLFFLSVFFVFVLTGCGPNTYDVVFDSKGGSLVESQVIEEETFIRIPQTSKEGHTLDGWYTSLDNGETLDERWSFTSDVVIGDLTLYAKWIVNQYIFTFNSNGGTEVDSITLDYGVEYSGPENPYREGYLFLGWYEDEELNEPFIFSTVPANDYQLFAKWAIQDFTISFDENGGTPILDITQDYNTQVTQN